MNMLFKFFFFIQEFDYVIKKIVSLSYAISIDS